MDAKSQEKVIAAGFTILRSEDYPTVRIKYKKQGAAHDWCTLERFPSKAARDRRMSELLQDTMIITD